METDSGLTLNVLAISGDLTLRVWVSVVVVVSVGGVLVALLVVVVVGRWLVCWFLGPVNPLGN